MNKDINGFDIPLDLMEIRAIKEKLPEIETVLSKKRQ
jgi:hypothetical protein